MNSPLLTTGHSPRRPPFVITIIGAAEGNSLARLSQRSSRHLPQLGRFPFRHGIPLIVP
jgi:hypothetical protein